MFKKAELSLNVVVASALAMIVLVILSVLVFNAGSDITRGTECENLGPEADCYSFDSCADVSVDQRYVEHPTASCPEGEICCIRQS